MFNRKKGLIVGPVVGLVFALLYFGLCYWMSTLPAFPGSLPSAFRPWWRYWRDSLVLFLVVTFMAGVLAATRPEIKRKPDKLETLIIGLITRLRKKT
jgi:hypothetical protein